MRLVRLLVTLCFALCAAAAAHAETAGQVIFAQGDALALREGRIVPLASGSPVESGDQIHTGADSYLQIRFTDWSLISLRPRTDFVVERYVYEQMTRGREQAFFVLLNGGLRSLTGMIGHRNRANYRMRTSTATIGVRGTHYGVLICKDDCRNEDGSLGENGVYGGVIEGRIAVSPYGGAPLEREFGAGEYFRLDNENSIPLRLFVPPAFFWDKLDPQARWRGRTFAGAPWKPAPTASGDPIGIPGSLLRSDGSLALSPITAPVLSQVGTLTSSTVNTVAGPLASTLSLVSPVIAPVATVAAPIIAPVMPVIAPVAPVLAPIAPIVPVTPIVSAPPAAVLPTLPALPPVTTLPSLLPRR
jgi:FecR protein